MFIRDSVWCADCVSWCWQGLGRDEQAANGASAARGSAAPAPAPTPRADRSRPQVLPHQGSGVGSEDEVGGPLQELVSSMKAGQLGHKMNDSDIHDQLVSCLSTHLSDRHILTLGLYAFAAEAVLLLPCGIRFCMALLVWFLSSVGSVLVQASLAKVPMCHASRAYPESSRVSAFWLLLVRVSVQNYEAHTLSQMTYGKALIANLLNTTVLCVSFKGTRLIWVLC